MLRIMTKEEYLKWRQTRGGPGSWSHADCQAADRLIKQVALAEFKKKLTCEHEPVNQLALHMVEAHFGSVEVDQALMALKCYPDWLGLGQS
jgi:hypothetical protein